LQLVRVGDDGAPFALQERAGVAVYHVPGTSANGEVPGRIDIAVGKRGRVKVCGHKEIGSGQADHCGGCTQSPPMPLPIKRLVSQTLFVTVPSFVLTNPPLLDIAGVKLVAA